jgi:hypothetical protein
VLIRQPHSHGGKIEHSTKLENSTVSLYQPEQEDRKMIPEVIWALNFIFQVVRAWSEIYIVI